MAAPSSSKQVIDSTSTATITSEVNRMDLSEPISNKISSETLNLIEGAESRENSAPPMCQNQ